MRKECKKLYKPNHPNANIRGYIIISRFIMSKYLGRPLKKNEVVHHINGDTFDNRLKNLKLFIKGKHNSFHNKNKTPWNKGKKGFQTAWNKGIRTGLIPKSAFKKGHIPWSKSQKGICLNTGRTHFKKGKPPVPHKKSCKCFRCNN